MNSLIRFPYKYDFQNPYPFNITIENSTFKKMSFCGSIISNNVIFNVAMDLTASQSYQYTDKALYHYTKFLDSSRNAFEQDYY